MFFFAQMFSRLSYAGLSSEVKRESSLTKEDVLLRQDFEELFSEALAKENFVEYSHRNNSPFYFAQMLSRLSYVGTVLRSPNVKTLGRRRPKPIPVCNISKAKENKY